MKAWRISKTKRASDLSGQGAAIDGGRWNNVDVPAVYMGLSPAICCLETFVHTNSYPLVPLTITQFILPDDPQLYLEPGSTELPEGWNTIPADTPSMSFGTQWLRQKQYLGLIVPSAVLPLERNIVVNPNHPAIADVFIDDQFKFMYDERMFNARSRP